MDSLPQETRNYVTRHEAARGNSVANNGDIHVTVNVKSDADPEKIGNRSHQVREIQDDKRSSGIADMTGVHQ